MRLAYADPPYPGKEHLYPENTEVDHAELIARLVTYDGWALSTMSTTLAQVLALCPPDVYVAAWVRTNAPPFNPERANAVRSWEPVIYVPARVTRDDPGRVRDVLHAETMTGPAQQAGLTGTKPQPFAQWIFRLLDARPTDDLHDVFPGSGAIGRAWESFAAQPSLLTPAPYRPRMRARYKAALLADSHLVQPTREGAR